MSHLSITTPRIKAETAIRTNRDPIERHRSAVLFSFRQKVKLSFDCANYTVKTVENPGELRQALLLRQEVFRQEFSQNPSSADSDFDALDIEADHLVVIDRAFQKVVGNYRLISSHYAPCFYSQEEFVLDEFLQFKGNKLELSRACVHPHYRRGIIMQLLWRGLMEYLTSTNAAYLFGCTSIKTINRGSIRSLTALLDEKSAFTDRYGVKPLLHCCPDRRSELEGDSVHHSSIEGLMPPLLKSYLRAGAQLCRYPAVDMDFQCTDFLTVLDLETMQRTYARKYLE
jgi:putative hemolysin